VEGWTPRQALALEQFRQRLFSEGAHRIEAEVFEFNEPGRRLLAGLGFEAEGVKRQAHFDGERYHDVIVFGLLAQNAPEVYFEALTSASLPAEDRIKRIDRVRGQSLLTMRVSEASARAKARIRGEPEPPSIWDLFRGASSRSASRPALTPAGGTDTAPATRAADTP